MRAPVIPGAPSIFCSRELLVGSLGLIRLSVGCSRLATPTMFAKGCPAGRFCTPGKVVPTPVWQPGQIGVKIWVCSCVRVTGGVTVFATVTLATAEEPTLPSASVAVAFTLIWPSSTVVVSQLTEYGE